MARHTSDGSFYQLTSFSSRCARIAAKPESRSVHAINNPPGPKQPCKQTASVRLRCRHAYRGVRRRRHVNSCGDYDQQLRRLRIALMRVKIFKTIPTVACSRNGTITCHGPTLPPSNAIIGRVFQKKIKGRKVMVLILE